MFIVMTGYIGLAYRRSNKRLYLLDVACDPVAFLERTEKQIAITGRNVKLGSLLNIDKAAAYITLGKYEEALELLLQIDQAKLTSSNALVVYTINLMVCYYELGDISRAEYLFETQISILSPMHPKVKDAVNILVGERYYFAGKYSESKAHLTKLLTGKLSKRVYLSLLFRLAQMDEIEGNFVLAKEKYKQVGEQGNKLFVAACAQNRLCALEGVS